MATAAMTYRVVEKLEFVWSLAALRSQTPSDTGDLDFIFSQNAGQPAHQYLRNKWFSSTSFETTPNAELSTTGLLAFSVITASQGTQQLRDSLQVALTIMSAKDHERYFQIIPSLTQHRTMFRAYVDFCLKFSNVCDSKNGLLNQDTEVVVVWSHLLEPLGEMLNLAFKDHLQKTRSQWLMNIPKPHNLGKITERLKTLEEDGIYEQFYCYDFDGDQRFQNGVQQILLRLAGRQEAGKQQSPDLLLQAKLFYFSRFYFEIGLPGYETWLKEKCKETYEPIPENEKNDEEKEELVSTKETDKDKKEHVADVAVIRNTQGEENEDGKEEAIEGHEMDSEKGTKIKTETVPKLEPDATMLTDEEKVKKMGEAEKLQPSATEPIGASAEVVETDVGMQLSFGASGVTMMGVTEMQHRKRDTSAEIETSMTHGNSLNTDFIIDPKQYDIAITTGESKDDVSDSIYPTSFMQILQLVQEGKEIPGVEKLVIEPTNYSPTESKMQLTAKPWQQ